MHVVQQFVQQSNQIKARRNAADRPGEDVIEHQRGNRELGQGFAHGFLDHAVNAAAHEHAAALDIKRAHSVGQQHDGEDEPRSAFADKVFRNGAGVERRRAHVVEHNRSRTPERDER